MKDEDIIVLDFLSRGHSESRKSEPIVQGIGDKFLSLLEVIVKEGSEVKNGNKLYIGEKERNEVKYIKGRIKYNDLTNFAKKELEYAIDKIIEENEKRFVDFFNIAKPITTRIHSLELLQGIGKKHMWAIIKGRKEKKFESFDELKERVDMLPNPKNMIKKRIIEELKEKDRHRLFVS